MADYTSPAWPERPLADLTTKIGSGATPRGGEAIYVRDGVAFIRSQNVLDRAFSSQGLVRIPKSAADELKGVTVQAGDVLVNITGESVARVCVVPSEVLPARVSQHVAIVRPGAELHSTFLGAWLAGPEAQSALHSLASGGGTRRALTKAQLEQFVVPVPPIGEQRAIADVLGALDDKIAANDLVTRLTESLALALASTARTRTTVAALATPVRDTVSPETFADAVVDHYSLPAFDSGRVPEVVEGRSIQSAKFAVTRPAVLISKLNPRIPRIWDVPAVGPRPAVCSTEFVVLQPYDVSTAALWTVVSQPGVSSAIQGMVAGTSGSHQRVRPADLMGVEVGDPATLGSGALVRIESLVARAHSARRERAALARLRDTLLPGLMAGRLRVREAQEAVAAAGGWS
jgi:type I restriction enzyme S subunit